MEDFFKAIESHPTAASCIAVFIIVLVAALKGDKEF